MFVTDVEATYVWSEAISRRRTQSEIAASLANNAVSYAFLVASVRASNTISIFTIVNFSQSVLIIISIIIINNNNTVMLVLDLDLDLGLRTIFEHQGFVLDVQSLGFIVWASAMASIQKTKLNHSIMFLMTSSDIQ